MQQLCNSERKAKKFVSTIAQLLTSLPNFQKSAKQRPQYFHKSLARMYNAWQQLRTVMASAQHLYQMEIPLNHGNLNYGNPKNNERKRRHNDTDRTSRTRRHW
jgi:hypothetical protein